MSNITISKAYSFDAAHQLKNSGWTKKENEEVFGKCAALHGHTYRLEVAVRGDIDPVTGMILNYFLLDKIVKPIVEQVDHKNLNDVFVDHLTTAEEMVKTIALWVQTDLEGRYDNIHVAQVTLQETPKTKAVWRP